MKKKDFSSVLPWFDNPWGSIILVAIIPGREFHNKFGTFRNAETRKWYGSRLVPDKIHLFLAMGFQGDGDPGIDGGEEVYFEGEFLSWIDPGRRTESCDLYVGRRSWAESNGMNGDPSVLEDQKHFFKICFCFRSISIAQKKGIVGGIQECEFQGFRKIRPWRGLKFREGMRKVCGRALEENPG